MNPSRSPSTTWTLEIVFAIPQRLATIAGICVCHGHVHNVRVCRWRWVTDICHSRPDFTQPVDRLLVRCCVGPVVGPGPQTILRPHNSNRPQYGANPPSPSGVAHKSSSKRASSSSNEWSRRCPSANNVINCNLLAALCFVDRDTQIPCSVIDSSKIPILGVPRGCGWLPHWQQQDGSHLAAVAIWRSLPSGDGETWNGDGIAFSSIINTASLRSPSARGHGRI